MIRCDDILFFIEVVNAGSLNKAAIILNTTQATISRRIQSLEKDLQQQLLIRSSRGFILSTIGEELYNEFKDLSNDLRNNLSEIVSNKEELKGSVKLAIFSTSILKILLPHIHKFTQQHPKVKIITHIINRPVDLIRDSSDLVISPMLPNSETAKVKVIFKTQLKLYCSPDYISRYSQPKNIEELNNHSILKIFAEDGTPVEYYLAKHHELPDKNQLIELPGSLYFRDATYSDLIIKAGHHIILGIPELAYEEVISGKIVEILPEYSFWDLSFYLIRYSSVNSLVEREFVHFIESVVNNWQKQGKSTTIGKFS